MLYAVIGVLAIELALRTGGKAASQRGALETLAGEPFGQALLIAVAVGLGAYAAWRLINALTGGRGGDQHSALERVAAGASGLIYATLCVTAVKILVGARTSGANNSPKHATAGVLGWPGGPEIVGGAGIIIIAVGLYQGYKGAARKFLEDSATERMGQTVRRVFTLVGVFGHLARAVTFLMIGYGLVKAALDYAPRNAIGLDGALQTLSRSSTGPLLLGIVAVGFIGFGLYSIMDARFHRV